VIDLGKETDLGRSHGVVVWEEELELEDAAYMLLVCNAVPPGELDSPSYGDCEGPSMVTSK
jgi:hypothetical protein